MNSDKPITLESFLLKNGFSRRLITKLKRIENGITCAGRLVRSVDMVTPGDVVVLKNPDGDALEPNPALNVPIAFENDNLIVFNKPSGMPVHPSIKHQGDTLGNYFAHLFPELTFRPVNRLDRDTSGLCIVAKNAHSANRLQGRCDKLYYAAVHGSAGENGTINAPIARQQESIILRCVREDGQDAITHFRQLRTNGSYSLEEITLETGRTHQIRVHFSHLGNPLAGDDMYGGSREHISRQALHCGRLTFPEPLTNEIITVNAPIPDDIMALFAETI